MVSIAPSPSLVPSSTNNTASISNPSVTPTPDVAIPTHSPTSLAAIDVVPIELGPKPIDKEQVLKDILKEKEHLLNENRLLQDHSTRVVDNKSTPLDEESQSSKTEEDNEEIPEYGSRSSYSKTSYTGGDFMQEVSRMTQGSSFIDETEQNLGDIPLPKLNAEEKNDIASKENAEIHAEMETCRSTNERLLDELRAAYDESELRIGEVRRDRADFQRDVMGDAQHKGFKKANAHKVLKFLESKIKYKVAKAKKVHERNQALHVVITRTNKQLGMKKELADVLHAVDFEQLHIHKQQNQQRLHDKTHELQRLKSSHAKASEALLKFTNISTALESASCKLTSLINHQNQTLEDLNEREPQLAHVGKDIERITRKKERLEELFHIFIQERDAQLGESQPNVLDYMQLRNEVYALRQEYQTWTQKVEVAEMCSRHASRRGSEKDSLSVDDMVPYKP